jgi:hypothetical protein
LRAALLVGAGAWLWKSVIEKHVIPKRVSVVAQDWIYRSGMMPPHLKKKLCSSIK